jgi:hypothetical protein
MNSKRSNKVILLGTPFHPPDFENIQRYGRLFSFTTLEGKKLKQSHYRPGQALRIPGG